MRRNRKLDILYEDTAVLVLRKPAGFPVQSARPGQPDLVSEVKNYRAKKKEEPYVGLIHRLDQPVEGVLVMAKTREAAAHLSAQVQKHQADKEYLAIVCWAKDEAETAACDLPDEGTLEDYLLRDGKTNTSSVVSPKTPGAKKASLSYRILKRNEEKDRCLVHIQLHTGRHHQIRVQFSHAGWPLYADHKYGPADPTDHYCPVALCSCRIGFVHPETGERMEFEIEPSWLQKAWE